MIPPLIRRLPFLYTLTSPAHTGSHTGSIKQLGRLVMTVVEVYQQQRMGVGRACGQPRNLFLRMNSGWNFGGMPASSSPFPKGGPIHTAPWSV